MVHEIIWTPKAQESFAQNLEYLQNRWTEKETEHFVKIVEAKIALLSTHPEIGKPGSKGHKNIRQTILNKRVLLIYLVRPKLKLVELLLFWNTYQNPAKFRLT